MLADDPGKRLLARCRQGGESRSEPQPHEMSKRHSTAARTRSKTAPRSTELEPSFWDPQGSDARYLLPGGTSNAASAAIAASKRPRPFLTSGSLTPMRSEFEQPLMMTRHRP